MGREGLEFFWVEEYTKRNNNNNNVNGWEEEEEEEHMHYTAKRKYTKKRIEKIEFCGWGSKPLIEFFQYIGKDTTNPISQYEAASFINKYITDHRLLHPTKKKRVVCDEWLLSLFGRRTISKNKIYDLLGSHFAENVVESESDDSSSSSRDERPFSRQLLQRVVNKKRKMVEESSKKSCFAAIVPENINLVYLKRSLVLKLVEEQTETFEGKVVGSFVRIKTDPNDYSQKNSHMLVQVTGVHRSLKNDDRNAEILLQVSNVVKDVTMSMLSDDNFSKEECQDLHQRAKDGLLQRLTVVALEEKVQSLHEDITKHWLVGELALLQRQIDRANEKGWRRELFEYMERRQLLQTPKEQSRLLQEVPKVIAEELEVEKVSAEEIEVESMLWDSPGNEPGSNGSLNSTLCGALEVHSCDAAVNESSSNSLSTGTAISGIHLSVTSSTHSKTIDDDLTEQCNKHSTEVLTEGCGETQPASLEEAQPLNLEEENITMGMSLKQVVQVIDLSDDEQQVEYPSDDYDLGSLIWNYTDPQGNVQGPFPITSLKRWSDANYFSPDFKVWKTGQSRKEAVLLTDILHKAFPP